MISRIIIRPPFLAVYDDILFALFPGLKPPFGAILASTEPPKAVGGIFEHRLLHREKGD